MAAPRIFVSSTYYDLRQTRDNIKGFIEGLGYEAVMHEHSGVAYTQNTNLEKDCYREISGCEIGNIAQFVQYCAVLWLQI